MVEAVHQLLAADDKIGSGCRFQASHCLLDNSARADVVFQAALSCSDRRREGGNAMGSAGSESTAPRWLVENGPKELELLFRAIIYPPSAPILITDNLFYVGSKD